MSDPREQVKQRLRQMDKNMFGPAAMDKSDPDPLVAPVVGGTPEEPLLDWVEREIYKPGYVLLRVLRAQRGPAGQRIILEELCQLIRAALVPRPEPRDVFPEIEDVLAKHCRGRVFEPTTRENIAAIIDRICELDAEKQQELQRLRPEPRARCVCGHTYEQHPTCRCTMFHAAVLPASAPSLEPCCCLAHHPNHGRCLQCPQHGLAAPEAPMNTHGLERTSPKGGSFLGRCVYCGKENLPMKAALEPCDKAPAQDQQILDALEPHAASAPSRPLEALIVEWREQIAELEQLLDVRDPDAYIYARRRSECDTLEMCVAELERLRVLVPGGDPQEP